LLRYVYIKIQKSKQFQGSKIKKPEQMPRLSLILQFENKRSFQQHQF